jgi:hypothetical protein
MVRFWPHVQTAQVESCENIGETRFEWSTCADCTSGFSGFGSENGVNEYVEDADLCCSLFL